MQAGMGVLRWPPREFWKATPVELNRAMEGWIQAHGGDQVKDGDDDPETMIRELEDLMERFPDGD